MPTPGRSATTPMPKRCEQRRRADARELQQLRGVERAAGHQHLRAGRRGTADPVAQVLDARRALAGEQDARRVRARDDPEVGAPPGRAQIARRRAAPQSSAHRPLVVAEAFLGRAVEIRIAPVAAFLGGRQVGVGQRVRLRRVRNRERPARAVILVGAALLVLGLAEVGQHVGVTPARIAEIAPPVVVLVLSAYVEEAVDRGRSAEHLAARLRDPPVGGARLRLARIEPVHRGIGEVLSVSERNVYPRAAVLAARLQQEHRAASRRGKPVGQHAARGARADHDEIVRVGGIHVRKVKDELELQGGQYLRRCRIAKDAGTGIRSQPRQSSEQ